MTKRSDLKKILVIILVIILMTILIKMMLQSSYESNEYVQYSSSGNLAGIDYEKIIYNASRAGYDVIDQNKKFGDYLFHIVELNEKLGNNFVISKILYRYDDKSYFVLDLYTSNKDEVIIKFYNDSIFENLSPFGLKNLPSDEWIIQKFKLMFNLDEDQALYYLNKLKDSINNTQDIFVTVIIDRRLDFMNVYFDLKGMSNNVTFSNPEGGLIKQSFYYQNESQNKETGGINYLISNTKIIYDNKEHIYSIQIDRSGRIIVTVKLKVGETIQEEDYRNIFKDMFTKIGIPPDKVNDFKFNYVNNSIMASN